MSTQSEKTEKKSSKFNFKTIKTFEDACKKLGIESTEVEIKAAHDEAIKPMKAYYKLVIIFLAINNGWKPDWGNTSQYKYYPWYWVLSSGFGFSDTLCYYDYSSTYVGSRLCTDSSEKAMYIAEQFKAEYQDYLLYSE
jgi:hypothetical protein